MNISSIETAIDSSAERPVSLRLTDGQTISVAHSDFAAFAPNAKEFILYRPALLVGFEIIALDEVASIIAGEPKRGAKT